MTRLIATVLSACALVVTMTVVPALHGGTAYADDGGGE